MRAKIYVTLKQAVLDPQGQAVQKTLARMGYDEVSSVRIGKYIEVEVGGEGDHEALSLRLKEMCEKLLANPVIEDYRVEL